MRFSAPKHAIAAILEEKKTPDLSLTQVAGMFAREIATLSPNSTSNHENRGRHPQASFVP